MFLVVIWLIALTAAKEWAIHLDSDPVKFAQENGYTYVKTLPFLDHVHVFSVNDRTRSIPNVRWASPQEPRMLVKRVVADPLYEDQWHLHTHLHSIDADRSPEVSGRGVKIAIVDDGVQWRHPDLMGNFDGMHSWDFNDHDSDPAPVDSRDGHGTCAAGVALAIRDNGHCGRGAAPHAKLIGIRLIAGPVTDVTEAEALTHHAIAQVDVHSCSWGPVDDGESLGFAGYVVQEMFAVYVGNKRGRLGKGSIYVWASGNGRHNNDSCAFDGYANSPFTIPVGALDFNGEQAWYSEGCSALMGVMPSSGAAMQGITTIDMMGSAGYDPGECTARFGGTSSAAPLAAGVIALLLQERPELTWRDVKHVLAKGATQVNVGDPDWNRNRAGYHHSHKYGFGLFKVPALLVALRSHTLVPPTMKIISMPDVLFTQRTGLIPLQQAALNVTNTNGMIFIEHVLLKVNLLHPQRGRITITMTSPQGTTSILAAPRPLDKNPDYPEQGWIFNSVRHWGESTVAGQWTVNVTETGAPRPNEGIVTRLQLTLYGF